MTQSVCPRCGAALPTRAPEGLCPRCLLQRGLPEAAPAGSTTTPHGAAFTAPRVADLAPLFPQLEILGLIGQGGMGAVYKARQLGLDRFVVLKILPHEAERDPSFTERFAREARALARLNHPNIVTVHDFGQKGSLYYLLMEYVDGVNLREAMKGGPLSPAAALEIVPQMCEALQYAHEEGVVHRDIKPENVLLDRKGRVKIADFGLAKMLGRSPGDFTLTGQQQVMGTLYYMAPEQMEHPLEVDHRADVFSLGVVFYEMLTGELPVGRFAAPSEKVHVDVRLDEIVLRALEKEPERRYQQVSEVKAQVDSIRGPTAAQIRRLGYEYKSKRTLFGWPLVHIAMGLDPITLRPRTARGIVAIGDRGAVGVLAIAGGYALGVLGLAGGLGIGLIGLGGVGFGLLLGCGGAALGSLALGGLAVGGVAMGGLAIGAVAIGGGAVGYYALGGGAWGVHALSGDVYDPQAFEFFRTWFPDSMMEPFRRRG